VSDDQIRVNFLDHGGDMGDNLRRRWQRGRQSAPADVAPQCGTSGGHLLLELASEPLGWCGRVATFPSGEVEQDHPVALSGSVRRERSSHDLGVHGVGSNDE
jgi:hypothetical protein